MTKDFKKDFIAKLEKAVPELKGKVQAGAVDAETPVPYAAFTTPEETPLRTIHGIAGVQVLFDLGVFHSRVAAAETLKQKVIKALDGTELAGKRCIYKSSDGYYADFNIHGYTITFRIV
ncbi:hypothetical protein KML24007_04030 [Alistipes indistinctus]|uniref:hypothetical protein n=1 Tax=Alistipes indistinctus TaxID=626932 RepID=UPI0036F1A8AF